MTTECYYHLKSGDILKYHGNYGKVIVKNRMFMFRELITKYEWKIVNYNLYRLVDNSEEKMLVLLENY